MTMQGMHTIVPGWSSETATPQGEEVSTSQAGDRDTSGKGSYLEGVGAT